MKLLTKRVKKFEKLDLWDVKLLKFATIAFTLFVLKIWPAAMDFVHRIDWKWFLGIAVVLALRPFIRTCCRK